MKRQLRRLFALVSILAGLVGATDLGAQSPLTANTLELDQKEARPKASLAEAAWLVGHWQGEGLGGVADEVWAPAHGGQMMAMFRLIKQEAPVFYELFLLVEESDSLVLKLKHFNPDMSGWEEKPAEAAVRFPLVQTTPTRLFFRGLTYEKVEENTLVIYLALRQKDGTRREEKFTLRRVNK